MLPPGAHGGAKPGSNGEGGRGRVVGIARLAAALASAGGGFGLGRDGAGNGARELELGLAVWLEPVLNDDFGAGVVGEHQGKGLGRLAGEVQDCEGESGALEPLVVAEPDDAVPEKVFIAAHAEGGGETAGEAVDFVVKLLSMSCLQDQQVTGALLASVVRW